MGAPAPHDDGCGRRGADRVKRVHDALRFTGQKSGPGVGRGDILRAGNGWGDGPVDAETNAERLGDETLGAVALIDGHGLLVRS